MKTHRLYLLTLALVGALMFAAVPLKASIAYGSINNFDTVNDTGKECHGFEIELDDIHSTDISYTYNWNHYGVPNIVEDNSVANHPKVFVRWESAKNPDGTWAAFTAIPSGPIAPTNGHMFTDPSVNFGGEHFGVGYNVPPTSVIYNWLVDNGVGALVHGGLVNVSTPVFTYVPPVAAAPAQVQAVIVPPVPPAPPPQEFGPASWVKEIRTTSHNANKVKLRDLVTDDPVNPSAKNWRNGEPDEVEAEWEILQKDSGKPDGGGNAKLAGVAEALPNGDEVVTRRYEFYKYTGPVDNETGEAMATAVAADGIHGVGTALVNGVNVDLTKIAIVGEFSGSQMAGVDVNAQLGLIDHLQDGRQNQAYAARTVVLPGAAPALVVTGGILPDGMTFDTVSGIISGTPTTAGTFSFNVTASDGIGPDVTKNYTFSIAAVGAALPAHSVVDSAPSPVGAGTTSGDGSYAPGADVTVTAVPVAGYMFVSWTDNGNVVSNIDIYTFAIDVNHSLVANFSPILPQYTITTVAVPAMGGTTAGDAVVDEGSSVTVVAIPNAGYTFSNWTEAGVIVSSSASYTFNVLADHTLVANFEPVVFYSVSCAALPLAGGTVAGGGSIANGSSTTVVATPNAGYFFINWTVGGTQVSSVASYTFTVSGNRSLVANFGIVGSTPRTVSTSASPISGGTTSGAGTYANGASVTVVATANPGYQFSKWKEGGSNVSSSASYTFTIAANRSLVATFTQVYSITASAFPATGGTTEMDSSSYKPGDVAKAIATAAAGYTFVNWTEGGVQVSTSATYSFPATGSRVLVANFQPVGGVVVSVAASPPAGGAVTGGGGYLVGASVTVSATPNAGYSFVNWMEGGTIVSSLPDFTFSASANHALTANFQARTSVTIAGGGWPLAGGAVTGVGSYWTGDAVSLAATPTPGYVFANWTENGAVVSASSTLAFTASASRTLVANFVLGYQITTGVAPVLAGTVTGGGVVNKGTSTTLTAAASSGYTFLNWTNGAGAVVSTSLAYTFTPSASDTYTANFEVPVLGVNYDFDSATPDLVLHQSVPLTQTLVGITATFTSPNASGPSVENATTTGYTLSGFGGKFLAPSSSTGTVVEVAFDQPISGVSVNFATVEDPAVATASTVQLSAFDTSSGTPVLVGTVIAHGTTKAGDSLPTGKISFNGGTGTFNSIRLELPGLPDGAQKFLIDDLVASPGGSTGGFLTLANPNWNITLSDFGYSDFCLDNTPGFQGREYLSGEWGGAIGYQKGGTTLSPTWFEPNFLYPDWRTNSNFSVVQGIHLVATNADGLPVAESVFSNGDLQITLRFEMLDTVVGTPMGVTAASAPGGSTYVNSNRYVLSQTCTIKNVSGAAVSNVQLFQFLHGFTAQHGVYDNHSYAGKLSNYQYDVTLAGVDGNSAGSGSSASGLEDYIGFHSKIAPSAFEIGAYGTEGNGVDDHVQGKPSDGVHLSIENNWAAAPFLGRKNRDSFSPTARWVSGGQRWELGSLADGQSTSFDILMSLLTGTTVTVTGGGGGGGGGGTHPGSGSCNGGSTHVGGADFAFDDISQTGTFFGSYSEADDTEMAEREGDGEFALPTFDKPSGSGTQLWNLRYTGSHNGLIHLTFHYNPALLPPGYDETKLTIRHFTNGAWEQLVGKVDTVNKTITVTSASLSPFALAVPTANAIPKITSTPVAGGNLQLTWMSDTTGWVLQESTDLLTWITSTQVVTTTGNASSVTISNPGGIFYRLAHP